MMTNRRSFLSLAAGTVAAAALLRPMSMRDAKAATAETFEITKTDAEWQKLLTPAQYTVLRKHNTESPHSSPLEKEHRKGTFACAACDLPLYDSATKFESGTGWPSFFDHPPNALGMSKDNYLIYTRDEVHCRRCGGHLGHMFDDGPKPTGIRYCMNGVSLQFHPATA